MWLGMICESPSAHLHKQKQVGIVLLKSTVEHVYTNGAFGPNAFGAFAV